MFIIGTLLFIVGGSFLGVELFYGGKLHKKIIYLIIFLLSIFCFVVEGVGYSKFDYKITYDVVADYFEIEEDNILSFEKPYRIIIKDRKPKFFLNLLNRKINYLIEIYEVGN